jgi:membrane-associated phospholipid phosphatase
LATLGLKRKQRQNGAKPAWQERPEHLSESTWNAARLVSTLTNPMVLCPICFAAVASEATPGWKERLKWWGLSCGLITLVPLIHIRWGVRTGRISDSQVSVRQERLVPYLAQLATVGLTYALLRRLQAPRLVTAVVVSVAGGMVVITGVTTVWKMSMHVTGAAGTATVIALLYGKPALPVLGLIPLVGWSRYVLDHHTPAQSAAGAALGAAAPIIVFHYMNPLDK